MVYVKALTQKPTKARRYGVDVAVKALSTRFGSEWAQKEFGDKATTAYVYGKIVGEVMLPKAKSHMLCVNKGRKKYDPVHMTKGCKVRSKKDRRTCDMYPCDHRFGTP